MKQKYNEENKEKIALKNGEVRLCLNIDVRNENEDLWLNAIKPKDRVDLKARLHQQLMLALWKFF